MSYINCQGILISYNLKVMLKQFCNNKYFISKLISVMYVGNLNETCSCETLHVLINYYIPFHYVTLRYVTLRYMHEYRDYMKFFLKITI